MTTPTSSILLSRSLGIGASSGFMASFDVALVTTVPREGRGIGAGSVRRDRAWDTSTSGGQQCHCHKNIYIIIYINNNNYYYYIIHTVHTIQIVERGLKKYNTYHVYPYNCLVAYIKHLNSAIESATTLFTWIIIPHLIGEKTL